MQNDKLLPPNGRCCDFGLRMCTHKLNRASGFLYLLHRVNLYTKPAFVCILIFFTVIPVFLSAQTVLPPASELKKLSVEELMNIEVTSVSKVPEKLTEVASAIQVITNDDIRRSTSTTLPEALRLASNLQVAKPNSHDWAISARGFNAAPLSNNTLSNKLLVMIDGRSVYTPLFGGVFWDIQNVLLNDIDRVEVVSGPGGSLWGANAVNGVINIMTKSAKETQGLFVSGSAGSYLHDYAAVRYGMRLDSNLYLRVYGQQFDEGSMKLKDGTDANDGWGMTQGGFRMDYYPSAKNSFSIHGDLYKGSEETPTNSLDNGHNLTARWVHTYSENSELIVQAYYDHTWKYQLKADFRNLLNTYDIDMQHRFRLNEHNIILWGLGYRLMDDNTNNATSISFIPAERNLSQVNTFVQDQLSLVPHKLELTVGTKLLYNDYSGYEIQPSARIAWTPTQKRTLWAAISRAVRTPSRFETDEITTVLSTPNRQFTSETVIAYEIGYRVRPIDRVSLSLAAYYNVYDNLRSVNTNPGPPTPYIFANDQKANTWGLEISGNVIANDWWRLRGGYTYLDKKFATKSPNVIPNASVIEALDPNHQVLLQSVMNLSKHLQLDVTGRYVGDINSTLPVTISVASYTTFDIRFAWESKKLSFSVCGQNLAARDHTEFATRQVPRNVSAKISFRF